MSGASMSCGCRGSAALNSPQCPLACSNACSVCSRQPAQSMPGRCAATWRSSGFSNCSETGLDTRLHVIRACMLNLQQAVRQRAFPDNMHSRRAQGLAGQEPSKKGKQPCLQCDEHVLLGLGGGDVAAIRVDGLVQRLDGVHVVLALQRYHPNLQRRRRKGRPAGKATFTRSSMEEYAFDIYMQLNEVSRSPPRRQKDDDLELPVL